MKKIKYLFPIFCLLSGVLMGCETQEKVLTIQDMITFAGSSNITYHSEQQFYYYPTGHLDKLIYIERDDVYAKMTDGLYDLTGYLYGTDTLVSSMHLERDVSGNVTEKTINLNNKIVTRVLQDSLGVIPWEESVYCNQIGKLKAEDFKTDDGKTYKFVGENNSIPMRIIHAAIPTSYFDLKEFSFTVENNRITSFLACETEANDVYLGDENYPEYMYGRRIYINLENINSTQVEQVTAYEDKEENDVLKTAIENLKNAENYTIESKLGEEKIALTKISSTDILQTIYNGDTNYLTGVHLYDNYYRYFQSIGSSLYAYSSTRVKELDFFKPSFDFSEDVFKKVGEENGEIIFEAYSTASGAVALIDFEMDYASEYSYKNGAIKVYIKDNQINRFEIPMLAYDYGTGAGKIDNLVVSYSDIGSTTIEESTWDSFTLDMPQITFTGWNDRLLSFDFNDKDETYKATPSVIFEKYLGDKNAIAFFLPKGLYQDITYDYWTGEKEGSPDTVELCFVVRVDDGNVTNSDIKKILENDGFVFDGGSYERENILIEVMIDSNNIIIDMFISIDK